MGISLKSADPLDQLRGGIAEDLAEVEGIAEVIPILEAALTRAKKLGGEKRGDFSTRTSTSSAAGNPNGPGGCEECRGRCLDIAPLSRRR